MKVTSSNFVQKIKELGRNANNLRTRPHRGKVYGSKRSKKCKIARH